VRDSVNRWERRRALLSGFLFGLYVDYRSHQRSCCADCVHNFLHLQMKAAITVGVVGFPNVGKSSVVNSLKRTQAVSVQATPCITKVMQEIELDNHVKLLDCPGILVSTSADNEASATLRNFTNVHDIKDAIAPGKTKINIG
jgi:ribosome biogenesis GTPase A